MSGNFPVLRDAGQCCKQLHVLHDAFGWLLVLMHLRTHVVAIMLAMGAGGVLRRRRQRVVSRDAHTTFTMLYIYVLQSIHAYKMLDIE
jgi:hypothetical protein